MQDTRYRIPRNLRWSCHACAKCCSSGLELGPVEPEVIAQLLDSGIGQQWEPAADGFHETLAREDGSAYHVLRQNDGRCVFLRDDDLCAVHALLGPDAKPGFCREFPYLFVDDPKGTVAVVRPACGSFPKSFLDGDEVGPELDRIANARRATPRYTWAPDSVQVLPGLAVSTSNWLALEDPLLAGVAQNLEAPAMSVARIREALVSVTERSLPPASTSRYEQALAAILHAFVALLTEVIAQDTGGQPHQTRFVQASLERVKLAQQRPPVLWDDTSISYLNLCLRSQILSKGFSAWGGLPEGLGVFLLGTEVAWRAGDGTVESLGEHLAEWTRLRDHRMGSALLRRASEATRDLFLHAGAS